MQRGAISKPLVCQRIGTFKGLLNTFLVVLGGIVGCSHEYLTLIERSDGKVSMHCLVCNGVACHSCAGIKGPIKIVVGHTLQTY